MAEKSKQSSSVVKQLLFPAYTDAGSNDTFRPNGPATAAIHQEMNSSTTKPAPYAESVCSDASTQVQNNLSSGSAMEAVRRTRDAATIRLPPSSAKDDAHNVNSLARHAANEHGMEIASGTKNENNHNPPSFFSSTKPTVLKQGVTTAVEPESPPKLSRQHHAVIPASQDLSGIDVAAERRNVSDSQSTMPSVEKEDTGGRIEGQSDEKPRGEERSEDVLAAESPASPGDGATTTPPPPPPSPPPMQSTLIDKNDKDDLPRVASQAGASVVSSTMATVNHASVNQILTEDSEQETNGPQWEEEATPEETAFGKALMFRRHLHENDASSDNLSTASEMGTVVGVSRLEELDSMVQHHEETQNQAQTAESDEVSTPKRQNHATTVWADDDSLSMPILDGKYSNYNENDEKKLPDREASSPRGGKAGGILSMAIRRIGSGLTGSAPNTPRVHSSPKSRYDGRRQNGQSSPPSSFLLRSPGSSARIAAKSSARRNRALSPRFSGFHRDSRRSIGRIPEHEAAVADQIGRNTTSDEITRPSINNSALHLARACFSFDAYDTSMDEQYDFHLPNVNTQELFLPTETSPARVRNKVWADDRISDKNSKSLFRGSASWDFGTSESSAFRTRSSFVRNGRGGNSNTYRSRFGASVSPGRSSNDREVQRTRAASDFSPRVISKEDPVELKSPQRIEIEREDALDILACLVERGVSMKDGDEEGADSRVSNNDKETGAADVASTKPDISAAVEELKELSRAAGSDDKAHELRLQVLSELMKSREYALEMRRVSKSASSWLKSIGRSSEGEGLSALTGTKSNDDAEKSSAQVVETQSPGENASEGIDLLTMKAMLHSARMEAREKSDHVDRLNTELAKCRAEIGRLKSSATTNAFRSPNRSILDESDDLSATDAEDEIDRSFDNASPIPENKDDQGLDSPFEDIIPLRQDKGDIRKFQAALEEANNIIRKLHAKLQGRVDGDSYDLPDEAPVIQLSEAAPGVDSPGNKDMSTVNVRMLDSENYVTDWGELRLPPPPDHGLRSPIVATLLEQWTSDLSLQQSLVSWMESVLSGSDPATVPPLALSNVDHQVRDGLVMHVLPLLLRRPDIRVDVQTRAHRLTTYDLAVTIDPLTAAGPAVGGTASQPDSHRQFLESTTDRSEIGANSTTHSAATALISNRVSNSTRGVGFFFSDDHNEGTAERGDGRGLTSQLSHDEMMSDAGGFANPEHPAGLMSALGGAIGGLWTRRKPIGSNGLEVDGSVQPVYEPRGNTPVVGPMITGDGMRTRVEGPAHKFDPDDASQQPYHRVVAAPPGRLCITFVEYRGHAMVSDVAPESPLVGWIFPSDILIAIDELPVSGMRVRDIIKILKDRISRQRALRVISSHDMTELTLNTSTGNEGAE